MKPGAAARTPQDPAAGSHAQARTEPHAGGSMLADLFVLTKVRLNSLVVFTAAAGYDLASPSRIDWLALMSAAAGTALVASGAAALNQVAERDIDRLMPRTQDRPLPSRRMTPVAGRAVGLGLAIVGLLLLGLGSGIVPAAIALATLLIYVVVYTPMKRHTSLSTVVGAVPGALPPVIGWTAAGGSIASPAAWSLFALMFFWQLPHFLAISWLYRDDYARGGLPMLAVIDKTGAITGRQALVWACTLVPISLLPTALGLTTRTYAIGAFVLGVAFAALAGLFAGSRSRTNAHRLFLGSLVYLPLVWILMAWARR